MTAYIPDPELDLVLERTLPVAPDRVWAAWTDPALLVQWFTPAPWKTVSADLDVRPGGRCVTTMESLEGERLPNAGCFLQVEPGRLFVFTSAMSSPTGTSNVARRRVHHMTAHRSPSGASVKYRTACIRYAADSTPMAARVTTEMDMRRR